MLFLVRPFFRNRSRHFALSDPKHCVCVRSHSDRLDQGERVYVDHKGIKVTFVHQTNPEIVTHQMDLTRRIYHRLMFRLLGEKVEHFPWAVGDRCSCYSGCVCRMRGVPLFKFDISLQIFWIFLSRTIFKAELAVFLFAIAAGLNTLTVSGCKYSTLSSVHSIFFSHWVALSH